MRLKIVLLVIALMISVQAASCSSSIGIGVNPGNMSFKLSPDTSEEQSLYVINTGKETARYEVFVDDSTYEDWFRFSSSSFDLKAGEYKEVKVALNVPATAETDVECKIKIPCTASGENIGTGVIIPVHIEISTSDQGYSKGDSLLLDPKQDIRSTGEKLEASAENWKEVADKSLDSASAGLANVSKKFEDLSTGLDNTSQKFENTGRRFEDLSTIFRSIIQYLANIIKICIAKI
ncbi:MAG: hypothetical protein QM426_02075 [Euryarchaeota archaeon]|nr:hypothetical protein [Euryarchaeota archaeon]